VRRPATEHDRPLPDPAGPGLVLRAISSGRITVRDVSPVVEGGRYPAKAVVAEHVPFAATVFREGHELVGATLVLRPAAPGAGKLAVPMTPDPAGEPDRWLCEAQPGTGGEWLFHVEGWADPYRTWREAVVLKAGAGHDLALELAEGAALLTRALSVVPPAVRDLLSTAIGRLRDERLARDDRLAVAVAPETADALRAHPYRELVTASAMYRLWVDRPRALYGAWYEMFPRSEGAVVADGAPARSGTLDSAARRLPAIAEMGFDVLYVTPIHPIGTSLRKGPNNTVSTSADDPGVPYAIGSSAGGHDAIHPDLGTLADFDAFVAAGRAVGLEVALDLALNASPDHPWVREHPEWFSIRHDGSIAYAENPPKKYQDIYPLNFDRDPAGLYAELLRIVRFWMSHGVRIFRVDNPHTKPLRFWEWLIRNVHATDPDVIFLSEAFTRPTMMHSLARVGFQQSYTYFTWRNSKSELTDYLTELASAPGADYLRPNLFVNTHDILHAYLQTGGRAAFKIRAVIAALASPTWGMYAGYELQEDQPLRPGSEEYLDSEKYQYRPRDWAAAEREGRSLGPYLRLINEFRRAHESTHWLRNLRFHDTDNAEVICFSKTTGVGPGADRVIVVVNLDPHQARACTVHLRMDQLNLQWGDRITVRDAITGSVWEWGEHNYVSLDPAAEPAHLLTATLAGQPSAGG
jgi:starch synthase (maltosyl-transferring)